MTKSNIIKHLAILALTAMLSANSADAYTRHEVKKGETLWGVAYKYGITADDIVKANPQASNGLKNGMILRIPDKDDLDNLNAQSTEIPVSDADAVSDNATESAEATDAVVLPQSRPTDADTVQPTTHEPTRHADKDTTHIYIAKFGDTLHSVSHKTRVSETELLAYNPLININNIPEGYPVRLTADAPHIAPGEYLSVVDSIVYKIAPEGTMSANETKSERELVVAVMLPFDTESETISRQSLLATDFYKGLLLAAKDALDINRFPLKIIAVDTQCDEDKFDSQLNELISSGVSVIIPPEDEVQLEKVESIALEHGITVINALNVRDEGYLKYPNVVQCNINQKLMYDKAIKALMYDYADYTPVILDLSGGRDEKLSFIEELRRQYEAQGKKVIDLPFKNVLTANDLNGLPETGKYVFIPKSGAADVFNKFSEALITLINENYTDDKYKVFGYPDWITFKGEQEDALHSMGATIYSRFYMDPVDVNAEEVNKSFIKWYGYQMEEVYPSQGMLGYDIGRMIFGKLKNTDAEMINETIADARYDGCQSSFKFRRADEPQTTTPGLVNECLYIIEYLPGTLTNAKTM